MKTKITHKKKKEIARKLMTGEEIKRGCPVFGSEGWNNRACSIRKRVEKQKEKQKKIKKSK